MAKIVSSDAAPAEAVHYSFAGIEFDLGGSGKKSYETDESAVLGAAEVHPWLSVERDPQDVFIGGYVDQLAPADDAFSAVGAPVNPNDPDAARAAEEAKHSEEAVPVAIDAGKVQTEPVVTAGTAETLAADPTSKTFDKVEQ